MVDILQKLRTGRVLTEAECAQIERALRFPEILEEIAEHERQHPNHGVNCACLDKYISELRRLTGNLDRKVQRRIDYVLGSACDNR